MKRVILLFIYVYQKYLSRIKPRTCRFYPTCSQYMEQAIGVFGLKRGFLMGIKRILRCNPYNQGGYDPIPEKQLRTGKGESY